RLLSVLPGELPAAIERLQADAKDQKRAAAALQNELAAFRAQELAASAETVRLRSGASCRLGARALDADANGVKSLAAAVTSRPEFVAALVTTTTPALAVVARSVDVSVSAQHVLAALLKAFGGKGGGRAELAQGGGLSAAPDAILAAARAAVL